MALYTPPPSRWQADEPGPSLFSQNAAARTAGVASPSTSAVPLAAEVDAVNQAWKHVKQIVSSDGKGADLYDLLIQSGKESLDPQQPGWPSLLRPRSPMMAQMPAMVMQRYSACQTVCFCGVFPGIRRAWASVDNSLFLWRFDKWNDVPLEYSNEEQAICAVGLVKPRPGVFVEAIQYLLVVCTTTEVVLLGVCCSAGNTADPLHEITIQPLPLYSISSDNVTMCTVASTPDGRTFLGGADGHLYEVLYNNEDTWRQRRCSKRDHSKGLSAYLPSFLPSLWQKPSAVLEIVLDNNRHILYTRCQNSAIQVFDLGSDGKDATVRRVAEMTDFLVQASNTAGGEIFRGRSPADRKGATVVHLAVIPPAESQKLHLLAVTQDGRRVYFTTTPSNSPASRRPQGLRAMVARQSPPQPVAASSRSGSKGLETTLAHYSSCVLLLSEAAGEGRSKLLITARDLTIPPLGTSTGARSPADSLREVVAELEMLIPGDTCAIQSLPTEQPLLAAGQLSVCDELTSQIVAPPPRFVLISTAGVLELEKRRPVDVLQQMLEERSNSKLEQFFKSYGAAEVAAMCILLVTTPPSDTSANVVQQAKSALENPSLTGVPQMRNDAGAENMPPNAGFDMGQAVPVAEPEWSGAHKGLCLYVARLLQPNWEQSVVAAQQPNNALLCCRLPAAMLQALEDRLRSLEGFLREAQQRRRIKAGSRAPSLYGDPTTSGRFPDAGDLNTPTHSGSTFNKRPRLEAAAKQEDQRTAGIRALVARAAEACFLLRVLSEHHMPRLASRLEENTRARLTPLKLRNWVCSPDGEAVAAQLISVLVTEHLSATGGLAEDLAATLQAGCPSYFKEDDKTFYQASGLLQRAESAASAADRQDLSNEALRSMMRVPLACDLGQVIPQLANLRNFAGCVELPLRKAAALDPSSLASRPGPEGHQAREARQEGCYVHVMSVLKVLINPGSAEGPDVASGLSVEDRAQSKTVLLHRAAKAEDPYFHEVLYNTLIDLRATKELLELDTPHLERHLQINGGLPALPAGAPIGPLSPSQVAHLELLAKLYIKRFNYEHAAGVYEALAERRSGVSDQAISLAERQEAYQNAVLQAKGHGSAEYVDRLEVKRRIVGLQQRLVEALKEQAASLPEGSEERGALQDVVTELQEEPKELAQLYNDYAQAFQEWGLALEMVALAQFTDAPFIRQLWDVYLRQAWDKKQAELASSSTEARSAAALEACCAHVERMGMQLFPNDTAFPALHVCLRLELVACGLWPERGPTVPDNQRVPSAMLKACNVREDIVLRVYEALLGQRGMEDAGEQLHLPVVRLRLLRSLLTVLSPLVQRMHDRQPGLLPYATFQGGARREAGLLMEACERYASEAGRLQPQAAAEELSNEFVALKRSLEGFFSIR